MKHKKVTILLFMLCMILGCRAQSGYASLTVESFSRSIADTLIVRLDVRTAEEFAQGHIANAVNIDVMKPDFEQKVSAQISKTNANGGPTTIAVNCRSGKRSKKAAELLVQMGYGVIELNAGYNGWMAAGMPVSKE